MTLTPPFLNVRWSYPEIGFERQRMTCTPRKARLIVFCSSASHSTLSCFKKKRFADFRFKKNSFHNQLILWNTTKVQKLFNELLFLLVVTNLPVSTSLSPRTGFKNTRLELMWALKNNDMFVLRLCGSDTPLRCQFSFEGPPNLINLIESEALVQLFGIAGAGLGAYRFNL